MMKYLDGPAWFAIVVGCLLLLALWCVGPAAGAQISITTQAAVVARTSAALRKSNEADTIAALRAEIASLQKRQKIERGVCAALTGFSLWHWSR